MTMEYIVENFSAVYNQIGLKYPKLNNSITKTIVATRMLKTYQDVDNIFDMLKDNEFVVRHFDNAHKAFSESVSKCATNVILNNGRIRLECFDDKIQMKNLRNIIEGFVNDY